MTAFSLILFNDNIEFFHFHACIQFTNSLILNKGCSVSPKHLWQCLGSFITEGWGSISDYLATKGITKNPRVYKIFLTQNFAPKSNSITANSSLNPLLSYKAMSQFPLCLTRINT